MGSRWPTLAVVVLVAGAGCLSGTPTAPSTTDTGPATDSTSTTDTASTTDEPPSAVRVTSVTFGDDLRNSTRDGFGVDTRPVVQLTDSRLDVTGEILGIGDPACIDVTANATVTSNGTVAVTVRSGADSPDGRACNLTAQHWPYRATVDVGDRRPQTVRVRHVDGGETLDAWVVRVDADDE